MLGNGSFTLAYTTGGKSISQTSSVGNLAYRMASLPIRTEKKLSELSNKEFLEHWKESSNGST